jgi:hypothetical protein
VHYGRGGSSRAPSLLLGWLQWLTRTKRFALRQSGHRSFSRFFTINIMGICSAYSAKCGINAILFSKGHQVSVVNRMWIVALFDALNPLLRDTA